MKRLKSYRSKQREYIWGTEREKSKNLLNVTIQVNARAAVTAFTCLISTAVTNVDLQRVTLGAVSKPCPLHTDDSRCRE